MVTNFEHITSELTQQELELIPILVKGFHKHRKENPILARDIVRQMNIYLKVRNYPVTFTEARLRKCVNFIRTNAILPLMATSNGYYISFDSDEIYSQEEDWDEAMWICIDTPSKRLQRIRFTSVIRIKKI